MLIGYIPFDTIILFETEWRRGADSAAPGKCQRLAEPGRMSETMCTSPAACGCQNLDDREVKKRQVLGYGSLVAAFAVVGLAKLQNSPEWVQAMPAIPFFFAYLNLFQARTRTCVALAFLEKDVSGGQTLPVADRATSRRLKSRSLKLIAGAAVLAAVSTAICWKL